MTWTFQDAPNTAVFTTRSLIEEEAWVYYVSHDASDGAWQFLPPDGPGAIEDARIVGLEEMTRLEPRLLELCDLPLGWHAWREQPDAAWRRARQNA